MTLAEAPPSPQKLIIITFFLKPSLTNNFFSVSPSTFNIQATSEVMSLYKGDYLLQNHVYLWDKNIALELKRSKL